MESSLVWTSVWTGVTVGLLILIPLALEFCKRNLPTAFGLILIFMLCYRFSPSFPEIRTLGLMLIQIPMHLLQGLSHFFPF